MEPKVAAALLRYRIMANIVGFALIILVFVAIPLQLWAHSLLLVKIIGTGHGYCYIVYLATAYDLARRSSWTWKQMVVTVLAGFVPGLALIVEHQVTKKMRGSLPEVARS
jgi:integral membrane protein